MDHLKQIPTANYDLMGEIMEKRFPANQEALTVVGLADPHIGGGCRRSELFKWLEWGRRNKDKVRFIGLGDVINNNIITSRGGTAYEDEMHPEQQKEEAVRIFRPYKDLFLAMIGGNHGRRSKRQVDMNPEKDIAYYLGIPYSEESVWLKIRLGKRNNGKPQVYTIYCSHGEWAGGKKTGSSINNLEDLARYINADLIMCGHTHKLHGSATVRLVPDTRNKIIKGEEMHFCCCSTFQGYGGFAILKGMSPSPIGSGIAVLSGTQKQIKVIV